MLESFFIKDHAERVEAQWRQKTLMSSEILGRSAHRYLRPEILEDRTRLDLMWNGKSLGVRGQLKANDTYDFFPVKKPDTVHPLISKMIDEFVEQPPSLKLAQVRFRLGLNQERGIWIDTSNEQIKRLLEEPVWIEEFLKKGYVIEAGQRHKEFIQTKDEGIKFVEARSFCWLPSFDQNNNAIPLKSYISLFSQPGPESNRSMIAAAFDLLDEAEIKTLSWIEWGAGYGNLSAAFASRLGTQAYSSELDGPSARLLQENSVEFFRGVECGQWSAEKGLPEAFAERGFDLWLIDPPRSGFSKLLSKIKGLKYKPTWILAYHCHSSGLIADTSMLKSVGYFLHNWTSTDIFPATPHHEVISLWKRI